MNETCECKDEWVGEPYGFVPTHWRCAKCQTRITAGEMLILRELRELDRALLRYELTKSH